MTYYMHSADPTWVRFSSPISKSILVGVGWVEISKTDYLRQRLDISNEVLQRLANETD